MKKIVAILFLLMSTFTLKMFSQKDTLQLHREARSFVREGNKLYKQQKFTDASIAYRKALDKNSQYSKATYNLGNALYQEKNYKEAVPQYELTAKTANDKFTKAEAFHNIGNAMMEQKQYDKAVEAYKNALRNNPKDDETRYNLAVAQKNLKKQQQNQKNNQNKDKKDQDNKDKQNKDKNKKDDKNKNQKDQDKKEGDDKDKKKDQKGDQDQKDKQQQDQEKGNKKDEPQPQQGTMTQQQIKQLLENLNNEEQKTQKKMNVRKSKGRKIKQEKDW